jgi:uncharacterized membrane protein YkoI
MIMTTSSPLAEEQYMQRKTKVVTAVAIATLAVAGTGTGAAIASSGGDDDATQVPIEGTDLERASAAALAHTGEGRVTETEVGDEESYYEVEVTLEDGSQVDVQLNEQFDVVGSEDDDDSGADD